LMEQGIVITIFRVTGSTRGISQNPWCCNRETNLPDWHLLHETSCRSGLFRMLETSFLLCSVWPCGK
jgi:hypothetical protein